MSAVLFMALDGEMFALSYIADVALCALAVVWIAVQTALSRGARRPSRLIISVAVLTLLALPVPALMHPLTVLNEIQMLSWPRHFTANAWRDNPERRWLMARDLAEGATLRGKTSGQVRQLLGEPTGSGSYADLEYRTPAPQRPSDFLFIWLHKGKVAGWALSSDGLMGSQYR
jgi:hypothetical protein